MMGHTGRNGRAGFRMLAGLAFFAWQSAAALPVVTGPEARAFLGGRTGKVVYLKGLGYDLRMYYVDFNDSVLVERKIADDGYVLTPTISPDGTRILYESGSAIYIRDLVENSPTRNLIFTRPQVGGQTLEPHWWIDPKTGDEYVQYQTGRIDDHEWPPKSGSTFLQKVVQNKPSGAAKVLMPFMMSAARSKNGMWGATSHHSTGMYKFYPDKIENAYFDGNNWLDLGALLGCNATISPSADPARQNRMMHLHSGGSLMGTKVYDNHKAVLIRSWNDPDADHPFWYMGIPGDRTIDDGSGNLFWGEPEWSNDENYLTATGSRDVEVLQEGDVYMVRINYSGDSQLLRVLKGGDRNLNSCLWVKTGVAPAKIRLDSAGLSFNASKKDAANPPAQTVNVSNVGDGTLPTLKLGPLPKWLKVSIIGNGTNSPKLVNAVSRDSVVPGDYQARVSVAFGLNADSASYAVSFKYADPLPTSLNPARAQVAVAVGDTARLSATVLDQFGKPLADPAPVAWSGVGAIQPSADGLFRADSIPWRTYLAIGKAGALACSVQVTVVRTLLRVDAGAEPGKAAPGWVEDGPFIQAGTPGKTAEAYRLMGVADPAPEAVYKSWQQGFKGYRFDKLPNARYRLRLHFVAPQGDIAGRLTLLVEGVKLLQDYRLSAVADSSGRAAEVREISVTVSDGNGLQMEAVGTGLPPALAGLEIQDIGLPPVVLVSPNGGEALRVGDTLRVRWTADSSISSCGIQISADSGKKWLPLTRTRSVATSDPDWGDFRWVIPDSLDGVSLVSRNIMVAVNDYFGTDRDRSDRVFAIAGNSVTLPGVVKGERDFFLSSLPGGRVRLILGPGAGAATAMVSDIRGRILKTYRISGAGIHLLELGRLPAGMYRFSLAGPGGIRSRYLPWLY